MKRYVKELIITAIQLFMFYIFPLFAGPTDAIGMVFIIIVSTFLLSSVIGCISNEQIKFLYPVTIALLFIPSVFIYYNESALIHSLWYLVISSVGLLIGLIIHKLTSIGNYGYKTHKKLIIILSVIVVLLIVLVSYFAISAIHLRQDISTTTQNIENPKKSDKEQNKKDTASTKADESIQSKNSVKETTIIYEISGTKASGFEDVIRTRLDSLGYVEAKITTTKKQIKVILPKQDNAREIAEKLIKMTALKFTDFEGNILLTDEDIKNAEVSKDKLNNSSYCIELEFTSAGREKFKSATTDISKKPTGQNIITILLDDILISAPSVSETIDSETCVISGDFTKNDAQRFANQIKSSLKNTSIKIVQIR